MHLTDDRSKSTPCHDYLPFTEQSRISFICQARETMDKILQDMEEPGADL